MAVWLDEIDLSDIWSEFRNQDMDDVQTFLNYRAKVFLRLADSEWACLYNFELAVVDTYTIDEFNNVLNDIYDAADIDRVWIKTF